MVCYFRNRQNSSEFSWKKFIKIKFFDIEMENELIYIDSNCYIDYFENRTDKLRPLGEFAYSLIRKTIECEYKIIISSLIIDELKFNSYENNIKELIKVLKEVKKIAYIRESEKDEQESRKLKRERKSPLNDTKHVVIARRAKVKFLVTRNMKDFEELLDLVELKYPENL